MPLRPDLALSDPPELTELPIREPQPLHLPERRPAFLVPDSLTARPPDRTARLPFTFGLEQLGHLVQEPGVDAGSLRHRLDRRAELERTLDLEHPLGRRRPEGREHRFERVVLQAVVGGRGAHHPAGTVRLQPAEPLLERLLERAADRHRLADGFHLGRERRIGRGEFLEGEARHLDHDVIEHRLERRRSDPGDVVGQLVQPIAHGHLGPDPGNGKPRGLGG